MAGDQEMTEAEEFATFDFLASYAPNGPGSTSQGPSTAPHEDERDAKWQRRDASNKGNPGKGRGLPKVGATPIAPLVRPLQVAWRPSARYIPVPLHGAKSGGHRHRRH